MQIKRIRTWLAIFLAVGWLAQAWADKQTSQTKHPDPAVAHAGLR
jgi:hypothetical protein